MDFDLRALNKYKLGTMIALEHVQRMRMKDLALIVALALVWWGLSAGVVYTFGSGSSYMASVLIAAGLMAFCVLLVQRAGTATIFFAVGSILSSAIPDIGPTGLPKILAYICAGLVFEAIYLIAKIEWKLLQVDVLAATAVSTGFLPLLLILFLSPIIATQLLVEALNLAFVSFFIGVLASTLAFLAWYHLRTTKAFLKFTYGI